MNNLSEVAIERTKKTEQNSEKEEEEKSKTVNGVNQH